MASLPSASTKPTSVQPGRIHVLKEGSHPPQNGPVVYWMFRDQRLKDNWALIHAVDQANKANVPVAIAFNLFDQFLGAKARQLGFMLKGLRQLQKSIEQTQIPFFLFQGTAEETIPKFLGECKASLLVTDFSPLRQIRKCKDEICKRVSDSVTIHEVDAHNVVPVWVASDKLEYSAKTIRGKINKLIPEYLINFPTLQPPNKKWDDATDWFIDWDGLIADVLRNGAEVPEIEWCEPGETAAMEVFMGNKDGFLTKRLKSYSTDRNNPLKPRALSCLSPYLHFGQISAQRCALEARSFRKLNAQAVDTFLEELIVRRELADNFCYYQPNYDTIQGAWEWARKTLMDHASDKREHTYTMEQLEKAQTADPVSKLLNFIIFFAMPRLWNASQLEMVHYGKMHGFMRQLRMLFAYLFSVIWDMLVQNFKTIYSMYWAKKILEWTKGPKEALEICIYLNDKYEIDGRDPNGYVGCMWSICGVHDQGWRERPVFGKIRFMNYAGCKRKFNVDGYIAYVKRLVGEIKKRKAESPVGQKTKQPRNEQH
ncbi:deoxyribodipyrimidine photo-lyase [Gossypium australe]|uniref:Deoxyribodipyrimidine photo-lyase n=1 Tax=Gossypium australe TaxID=47621 RepID=A0A5B6UMF6_9ROSI|nr:deoxyribodipyrimidine photo-lyase [Gossypium australe]